ncbi:MAG: bifunctional 5,10-methylenetetrahydrofolate dehydrogenase/5,10-methenyltetrahydrofolate cyclohydrolase [Candidatus Paceibacterota bacterium]|jgi:methylenetetrahydrofolate dehydrogenase (NADP+)/methenyltetrahydrofolate cyclohydrolase
MIVDGKKLADDIKTTLRLALLAQGKNLRLDVILVGDNLVSQKYVKRKKKVGEEIGIEVIVHELMREITQIELEEEIENLNNNERVNGIIVQLPLPPQIDQEKILNLVSPDKDIDALSREAKVLSPTVGAIREILEKNKVSLAGKRVVVVGNGKLVGRPVSVWLTQEGVSVEVIDIDTKNPEEALLQADIIVSGVGKPGLITSDKIKEGVVLIDAGTAESGGQLKGDADPACAEKCSLFTPVPGGVGSLTVVMLFKNLLELSQ